MKRVLCVTAVAVGLTIGAGGGGAAIADSKSCGSINLGGPKVFFKHGMNCKSAKQKARQVYESGGANEPRHFDCESGSNFVDGGGCEHVSKDKYFGWHPAD